MTTLERPRLLRILDAALTDRHVVITAPAGYGKSTVLRHLSRNRPHSYLLVLTPADADLAVLQNRLEPFLTTVATLLLDDIQHVEESPEVQAWIAQQLRREDLRFVLSGRTRLAWLLDTLLTNGQALWLDEGTLRFTSAETEALLSRSRSQPSGEIAQWQQRLQGWPIGLGLLAQLTDRPNPLSATREHLFSYLASAVFAGLPPELRRFVQTTAVPLQFNDELAAHLLKSADAQSLRQQVQQHSLFLEETEQPGWFRYHALIRAFLLETTALDLTPLYDQTVHWFAAQGDLEAAIEHALAGELQQTAVQLIEQLPAAFLFYDCRYLTYRRWMRALDPTVRDAHPMLLIRLGNHLHYVPGLASEAKAYLTYAAELTRTREQTVENLWASINLARINVSEGNHPRAIHALQAASQHPDATVEQRRLSFEILSMILCDLARFREARRTSAAMLALSSDTEERKLVQHRQNLAVALLIPLGEYAQAAEIMQQTLRYFADAPAWQHHTLLNWCELCIATGDWKAAAETLGKAEALQNAVETPDVQDQFWLCTYQAMLAIYRREWDTARQSLAHLQQHVAGYEWTAVWAGVVEVWLLRRQGQWMDAVDRAGEILGRQFHMPFERARLALERDMALGFAWLAGECDELTLHAETTNLIHWRCRAELVRLRALLAIICWRQENPRWRRHTRAALYACRTYPRYAKLLIHRDPDLGAYFWPLALIAGFAGEQALDALAEIGQWKPVLPLLRHAEPHVRRSAAAALAAVGREEAMPPLHNALAAETDGDTAAVLDRALATLEGESPPPLRVQMMGGFALVRGDVEIPAAAWPRPIVLRLFHYFALHRGIALPRDRILDDLWPDTDPAKAWTTFRSVYSRLRSVLEPFVRSKGPNRYISLEGDAYRFDPLDVVQIDFEQFESTVRGALRAAQTTDVPPLSSDFLAGLTTYAPLLPEFPYEDWLLETRQRLDDLYVEGCLYAAQALLVRGQTVDAASWAQRAIERAPWLEEAYQSLMRALARQGQRSQALRVYEEAVAALRRELDVPPSPQTEWLAERLRVGEGI